MDSPLGVLVFFGALAVWLGLLFDAIRRQSWSLFAWWGSRFSMLGFYEMSACVWSTALFGVLSIRAGHRGAHRVWMYRFAGAMWGSFWLFRVLLFVLDPLPRDYRYAAIQIVLWTSAPLGIAIAEAWGRSVDRAAARRPAPELDRPVAVS